MKIPKQVDILGYKFQVTEQEELGELNGELGKMWPSKQIIFLDKKQCQEQKESSFIHEIIEAINAQLDLELPHKSIIALETGIYSVLKTNKLLK